MNQHKNTLKISSFCYFILILFSVGQPLAGQTKISRENYQLLWRISGNGLTHPSYLLGTMHVQDDRVFAFSDSVLAAFERCETMALEVDISDILSTDMQSRTQLEDVPEPEVAYDTTDFLKAELSAEEYDYVVKSLKHKTGLNYKNLINKDPDFIEMLMSDKDEEQDYSHETFLDLYLYGLGAKLGKESFGLEHYNSEYVKRELFPTKFDKDLFLFNIRKTMEKKSQAVDPMETMTQLYYSGDIEKIFDFFQHYAGDDSLNAHIPARNRVMAHSIDSLVHLHTLFSAVGVAHLPGENGLIHLLREMGYTMEPVEASFTGLADALEKKFTDQYGYTVQQLSDGYSLDFPARPEYTKYPNSNLVVVNYTDFSTRKTYVFMTTPVADIALDNQSIYSQMLDRLLTSIPTDHYDTATVVMNGMEGFDIRLQLTPASTLRYEIFIRNGKSYMVGLQGTAAEVEDARSEEFIHSLHIFDIERSTVEYVLLADTASGFKLLMPEKYTYYASEQAQDQYDVKHTRFTQYLYSAQDANLNASYVFTWFDLPQGNYYGDDSVYYSITRDLMKKSYKLDTGKINMTLVQQPIPGVFYDFISDNGTKVLFYSWLRGNRSYSAIYQIDTNHLTAPEFSDAINSFELMPLYAPELKSQTFFNGSLQLLFPVDTSQQDSEYFGYTVDSLSLVHAVDHGSAATFTSTRYLFNSLTWYPDLDSIFSNRVALMTDEKDSITGVVKNYDVTCPTYEFIIEHPTLNNFRKYKLILNGEYVYMVMVTAPLEQKNELVLKSYFDDITVLKPAADTRLMIHSKFPEVLAALSASDTILREKAERALNVIHPEKADLPLIYAALKTRFPDEDDTLKYNRTKTQLIYLLSDQKDDQTLKELTDYYRNTKVKRDRSHILSALASIRTEASMDSFFEYGKLLNEDIGYLFSVFTSFYDSSEYFIQHFDRFMQLNPSSGMMDGVVSVLNYIINNDSTGLTFYLPYENSFSQLFDETLARYQKEKNDDLLSDLEWHLSDLAELLYRGYDAGHHIDQFKSLLSAGQSNYLKGRAATGLLDAGIDPGKKVLLPLLNDNYNNFIFMNNLSDIKKINAVYKYLQPQDIARMKISEWLNYEDDYVDKIEFIETFPAGNDSIMYVFRVYYDYDETWYYAGVGPYAPGEMNFEREPAYIDSYIEEYDKSRLKAVEKIILDAWKNPTQDY